MQNKVWFKKIDGLVAAFMIPLIAMLIIFVQRGIFPFGDESFLRTDMYHQYAPFFSEFKYKLSNGGSLLYTWNIGMGINFSALYAYYLASPLNWLIVFVPKKFVLEFMTYMIVLKTSLSGLSFAYYLSKHGKKEKAGIAFFGTFYALSGYMAAYNWNIMWLDCIVLFPLICLGLEKLVFDKRGFLYAIFLGLSITSNYYISIMICIFMAIYFIALVVIKRKKSLKEICFTSARFCLYSLIAGGISALVLLPEIYALKDTASGEFNFPQTFSQYFSIIDMFARHMIGVKTEIGLNHWPNIYCGVAIYIFVALYILNKRISLKEKIVYAVMIIFMLASFSIDVLNYIWHGLHYPNSLPARQSFIYIFLILYICYRAYYNLNWSSLADLGHSALAAIGFIILSQKVVTDDHFSFGVFYATMILVAIYAFMIYAYKTKIININVIMLIVAIIVLIESTVNTALTSISTVSRSEYTNDNNAVAKVLENLPKDDFYRIEKVNRKTKNDGAWMNFRSVSLFSSTARASLSTFFKKMGVESSTNAYSITGSTPLVDMLFSVKYGIYTGESNLPYLNLISSWDNTYLYENPYTLPIAYMVGPGFESSWDRSLENPAEIQNNLCNIIGSPNVLIEEDGFIENTSSYKFTTSSNGHYYAFVTNSSVENVKVVIESTGVEKKFENVNRRYMLDLGYIEDGTSVTLSNSDGKPMDMKAYKFDISSLEKAYEMLSISTFKLTALKDNYIEGDIEAGPDEVMLTSIPFDKGWKVKVDNVEVKTREGLEAFLAIDLKEGKHHIVMEYMPEGFVLGAYITLGSIILLLLIYGFMLMKVLDDKAKRIKLRVSQVAKEDSITNDSIENTNKEINLISQDFKPEESPFKEDVETKDIEKGDAETENIDTKNVEVDIKNIDNDNIDTDNIETKDNSIENTEIKNLDIDIEDIDIENVDEDTK